MNAQALFRAGENVPSAWFCGQCRIVASSAMAADECCKPRICGECRSGIVERGWTICGPCRQSSQEAKERARAAAARRVQLADYTLPLVYVESAESFVDPDEFSDWEDYGNDGPAPAYAYGVERIPFRIVAESIVENALEDHHEDAADGITDSQMDELQRFLDGWCARAEVRSYRPDYTTRVVADA